MEIETACEQVLAACGVRTHHSLSLSRRKPPRLTRSPHLTRAGRRPPSGRPDDPFDGVVDGRRGTSMEVEGARRPVRRPSRGLDVRRGGPSDVHRGASTATSASVGARRRRSRNFPRQVEAPLGGHPDGGRGAPPMEVGNIPMEVEPQPRWSSGRPDGRRGRPRRRRAVISTSIGAPRRPRRDFLAGFAFRLVGTHGRLGRPQAAPVSAPTA